MFIQNLEIDRNGVSGYRARALLRENAFTKLQAILFTVFFYFYYFYSVLLK